MQIRFTMYGVKTLCYVTKTFRNVWRKTLHYDTNVTHLFFSIGVFLYILFERKENFYIMKDTKLIDIIIPAYKAQNTIDKTVASVAIQNIADQCVVTIVNDGEKGNYKKTVDRFKDMVEIREIIQISEYRFQSTIKRPSNFAILSCISLKVAIN